MRYIALTMITALLAAACGSSTGPQGKDPTVLMTNGSSFAAVTLVWYDQSGQVGQWTAAIGQTVCAKFTATTPADSVRYVAFFGDTTGASGQFEKQWSPWFDPATGVTSDPTAYPDGAEYWTLDVTDNGFLLKTVAQAPCQ